MNEAKNAKTKRNFEKKNLREKYILVQIQNI